jgi:hypothetical protein
MGEQKKSMAAWIEQLADGTPDQDNGRVYAFQ